MATKGLRNHWTLRDLPAPIQEYLGLSIFFQVVFDKHLFHTYYSTVQTVMCFIH